jgi:hypothetical protein
METNNFAYPPIFLSSADSYSDVWELFFTLFKKYWPEYDGTIYLNTQEKEIKVDGLNIVCTKLGYLGSFGKEMRACLDLIPSDSVMLMLIDFIFMDKVDDQKIREYFEYFKNKDFDTLNFQYYLSENQVETGHPDLIEVRPPAPHLFFNYQIAFWKKTVLYEMVLPYENPWTSEWFGAKRAEKMNIKQVLVKSNISPINYHQSGCLAKAKWHPVAVEFLKKNQINVDFSKRGFTDMDSKNTIKKRWQIKKMIVKDGLKGSYLDLWTRKSLY